MAYYSFLHFKRKEFTKKEASFWLLLWPTLIIITFIPDVLKPFSRQVGFARLLDAYIIFGFLFLISTTLYMYTLIRKSQKNIEDIIRKIALNKAETKDQNVE